MSDARDFILTHLRLEEVPSIPEIRLYRAHPASRLSRLIGDDAAAPYWAYHWAGGTVLARYVLDHPYCVRGRRVVDLGAGSGIVGIAAALCGAAEVVAVDIDPYAATVIPLNAEANGVTLTVQNGELTVPPDADLILAGDIFYEPELAARMAAFCTACVHAGIEVLVGDMGRKPLPLDLLTPLAAYDVPDFGQAGLLPARVFRFTGASQGNSN
ncbi:hypothetical protein AEAC466_00470 [Asticcacaulis sp. AC466]|uniref:class I SAM-dependent methyltransferase n=1 Tax=Asticcacaulis sp. AC466 TaxID=1282362 RepID=UPI0003C3D7CF|nr:50S ribosomal protein L11 methyltransferase [Asticcacaulis sp. AC466]ESQ85678.1 hypothetical protein AEAC466_00470 [Asticcacaulis sp. AC466]